MQIQTISFLGKDLMATDNELSESISKYDKKISIKGWNSIDKIIAETSPAQKQLILKCLLKHIHKSMKGAEIEKNILMVLNAFTKRKNGFLSN